MEDQVIKEAIKAINRQVKPEASNVRNGLLCALAFKQLEDLVGNQHNGYNSIQISFDDSTNTYHVKTEGKQLTQVYDAKSLRQALIGV